MEDTALGSLLYVKYGFGIRSLEIYQNSAHIECVTFITLQIFSCVKLMGSQGFFEGNGFST